MNTNVNMVAPIVCPSCGEYDRCYSAGCICPSCWLPDGQDYGTALSAWKYFAPLMVALDEAELYWGWSYKFDHDGFVYSLEVADDFDVNAFRGEYLVTYPHRLRHATHTDPPEYEERDLILTGDESAVVHAINEVMER
jgi:hypothetical protein